MNDASKKPQTDTEWAQDLLRRRGAEDRRAFDQAKSTQLAAGKEPFDLEKLYEGWPWCPDFRGRTPEHGFLLSRERRIREWERTYFLYSPGVSTMSEFIEKMKDAQLWGAFD